MNKKLVLMILILALTANQLVQAQSTVTPETLTLTIYSNGVTQVDYTAGSDPTKVRVETTLFGEDIENLVVRDEDGNPLQVTLINETARIDSIGALELHFSYRTTSLTHQEDAIWVVNITAPINTTIILPENAKFLDMNNIPFDIGSFGEAPYFIFPQGINYVYYILGVPSVAADANTSITKVAKYITEKESLGYILMGAVELLTESYAFYESENYLEAKNAADDAMLVATDLVDYADIATQAIHSAESAIAEANQLGRTEGLDAAESTLILAQTFYSLGEYRNAEISALQAIEEASQAEAPAKNYSTYLAVAAILLLLLLWFKRKNFGF